MDDSESVLVLRPITSAAGRFFSSSVIFVSVPVQKGLAWLMTYENPY
jgi:hypothetical protein